jgi:predicted DNA-binding transcriptional regulator AlpA
MPSPVSRSTDVNGLASEVLTLNEAAAFLRLEQDEVVRLIREQGLPARLACTEWRFLQSAIRDWLSTPIARPSKEAQLAVAGAWKDDPLVEKELQEIFEQRGRRMNEN